MLKPGAKGTYTVRAQSGTYHLIPFLGQVLTEPLSLPPKFSAFTALPVKQGRRARPDGPDLGADPHLQPVSEPVRLRPEPHDELHTAAASQTAQTKVGSSQRYGCAYTGTRVQYSATEVTNVPYPKHYTH